MRRHADGADPRPRRAAPHRNAADAPRPRRRPGRWRTSSAATRWSTLIVEAQPHLLRRRPHAPPRLGLWLRRLPGVRIAREGLGRQLALRAAAPMTYAVKEISTRCRARARAPGAPAVFLRFAGCNLWSGREQDRADAVCTVLRHAISSARTATAAASSRRAEALARAAAALWPGRRRALCRLHRRRAAAAARRAADRRRCTRTASRSPSRPTARCRRRRASTGSASAPRPTRRSCSRAGDELKLVYPQAGADPERYEHLAFTHFFLQPMDSPAARGEHASAAIAYCLAHPHWRLSLQTHKDLGLR